MLGFSSDWAVASSHPKTCETNPLSHIITKSQLFWVSTVISNRWPSDTVVVSVLHVSVSSRSRDSNVSVSSRSLHLTSRLHRTSKVKLRTITTKFSILPLQRYLSCLSISVENRHFCLFLNYTVSQKKEATKLLPITFSNLNRFSKFFHCWIEDEYFQQNCVIRCKW